MKIIINRDGYWEVRIISAYVNVRRVFLNKNQAIEYEEV